MTAAEARSRARAARPGPGLAGARLVGALSLALAGLTARPASAESGDPLAEAEAAYGRVDFETTIARADEALEGGGLRPPQLARVYELIGISASALEQAERARDAFVRMLALEPGAQLDRTLSPSLRGPFMEARGYWATHTERLAVEVELARRRGALRVELTDPLRMSRTVIVRARAEGSEEYAETRFPAGESTYVEVPGADEAARVEYYLVVLDEHGNRIVSEGDHDVPSVVGRPGGGRAAGAGLVEPARPVTSRAWFWVVVGVVAAAAVAGAVTAGVVLHEQSRTVSVATDVAF